MPWRHGSRLNEHVPEKLPAAAAAVASPGEAASLAAAASDFGSPLGPVDPKNPLLYLDVGVDDVPTGRLVFEVKLDKARTAGEVLLARQAAGAFSGQPICLIAPKGQSDRWLGVFAGDADVMEAPRSARGGALGHWARGIVSVADPLTCGRLVILLTSTPGLNKTHTPVGQVVHGYDTLTALEEAAIADEPRLSIIGSGFVRAEFGKAMPAPAPAPAPSPAPVLRLEKQAELTFLHSNEHTATTHTHI